MIVIIFSYHRNLSRCSWPRRARAYSYRPYLDPLAGPSLAHQAWPTKPDGLKRAGQVRLKQTPDARRLRLLSPRQAAVRAVRESDAVHFESVYVVKGCN